MPSTTRSRDYRRVHLLVAVYLAAIITANLVAARFGPTATVYNAFVLIALDLIARDRLADFWGTTRLLKMTALILAGAGLTFLIAQNARVLAEASAISFVCAETGEGIVYHLLHRRAWFQRANTAAWLGAAIDSFVFPSLAFGGVMWSTTVGQFTAKTAGALLWSTVIVKVRPSHGEVQA